MGMKMSTAKRSKVEAPTNGAPVSRMEEEQERETGGAVFRRFEKFSHRSFLSDQGQFLDSYEEFIRKENETSPANKTWDEDTFWFLFQFVKDNVLLWKDIFGNDFTVPSEENEQFHNVHVLRRVLLCNTSNFGLFVWHYQNRTKTTPGCFSFTCTDEVDKMRQKLLQFFGETMTPVSENAPSQIVSDFLMTCFHSKRRETARAAWKTLLKIGESPDTLLARKLADFQIIVDNCLKTPNKFVSDSIFQMQLTQCFQFLQNFASYLVWKQKDIFFTLLDSLVILPAVSTKIQDFISIYDEFPLFILEKELNYLMFRAFYDEKYPILKNMYLKLIAAFYLKCSFTFQSEVLKFLLRYRLQRKQLTAEGKIPEQLLLSSAGGEEVEEYLLPSCSSQLITLPDLPRAKINSFLLSKSKAKPFNMLVMNIQYEIYFKINYDFLKNSFELSQQVLLRSGIPVSMVAQITFQSHPDFAPMKILESYFSIKRYQKEEMLSALLVSLPGNSEALQEIFQYLLAKCNQIRSGGSQEFDEGTNYTVYSVTQLLLTLSKNLNDEQMRELKKCHPTIR
jgi:hypothetical protein